MLCTTTHCKLCTILLLIRRWTFGAVLSTWNRSHVLSKHSQCGSSPFLSCTSLLNILIVDVELFPCLCWLDLLSTPTVSTYTCFSHPLLSVFWMQPILLVSPTLRVHQCWVWNYPSSLIYCCFCPHVSWTTISTNGLHFILPSAPILHCSANPLNSPDVIYIVPSPSQIHFPRFYSLSQQFVCRLLHMIHL